MMSTPTSPGAPSVPTHAEVSAATSTGMVQGANVSVFGASLGVVVIMLFHMRGIDFPAGGEAAITGLITSVAVYVRAILSKLLGVSFP